MCKGQQRLPGSQSTTTSRVDLEKVLDGDNDTFNVNFNVEGNNS